MGRRFRKWMLRAGMAAGAAGAIGPPAHAALYTWGGDASGGWSNPAKWVLNPPFCTTQCYPRTANDDALIEDSTTITFSETLTIDDLTVSSSASPPTVTFVSDGQTTYKVTADSILITNATVWADDLAVLEAQGQGFAPPCE